jgi:hypothetical protein
LAGRICRPLGCHCRPLNGHGLAVWGEGGDGRSSRLHQASGEDEVKEACHYCAVGGRQGRCWAWEGLREGSLAHGHRRFLCLQAKSTTSHCLTWPTPCSPPPGSSTSPKEAEVIAGRDRVVNGAQGGLMQTKEVCETIGGTEQRTGRGIVHEKNVQ